MHGRPVLRSLAVLLIFLCLALPVSAEEWTGKCVGVIDGDTIDVMREGQAVRVRLHGVDAPESDQAYGTKARQFTSEHSFGKQVRVVIQDIDRYGRTVGDVYLPDGKRLNEELVIAGMAWWYKQYAPRDTKLQRRQFDAMTKKVGLWSDALPVAPWVFRRGKGSAVEQAGEPSTTRSSPGERINRPDFGAGQAQEAPPGVRVMERQGTETRAPVPSEQPTQVRPQASDPETLSRRTASASGAAIDRVRDAHGREVSPGRVSVSQEPDSDGVERSAGAVRAVQGV